MTQMSKLYDKVSKDSALFEKFQTILKAAEKDGPESTEEKLTAFAKEQGFEISLEEMQTFFRDLSAKNDKELSETELDAVAGGKSREIACMNFGFSMGTAGIGCAVMSVVESFSDQGCSLTEPLDPEPKRRY